VANGIHLNLALEVEVGVRGFASGLDGGDEGDGKALFPGSVEGLEIVDGAGGGGLGGIGFGAEVVW
jgi:hypothetical protein